MAKLFDHMAELEPKREREASSASATPSAEAPAGAPEARRLAPTPDDVSIQAFRKAGGKWAKWCAPWHAAGAVAPELSLRARLRPGRAD